MKTPARLALALLVTASSWQLRAQTTAPSPTPTSTTPATEKEEEIVSLTPFEITEETDNGYQATQTLAGTRIRTDLKDVGTAISVITKEFLQDVGATDNSTLLQYTTNAEVAGTRGTYAGLGNGTSVDESGTLRAPGGAQRVRGLASADNTRDFFVTDIPWDSYNVDRIDIQRGANSILFGLGSPAGIVNATTRSADFRNHGEVVGRVGSYGSVRSSLDVNQELIDNVLAVRFDGLWSREKYEQKPAQQDDKRFFGAVRFDPQLFKDRSFHTSIKAKFENGDIKANRPRILPPQDSLTPWFRGPDTTSIYGGMGKYTAANAYALGSAPQNTNGWLSSVANQQQPIWMIDGTSDQLYRIYGGYVNTGARNNDGTNRGASSSIIGQRYSEELFQLTSLSGYANNVKLPNNAYGQYRNMSLLDSSAFDFYNTLIDGPTKSEFEKWNAYNVDISQTAFNDRLGVQVSFDRQKYKRGGQSLLGNPTLTIDILQNFQDLTANPNFGRPFIVGGPGGGNSYEGDRKYTRASIFGEVRATDYLDRNGLLAKILGKHRFTGVYSKENYATTNLSWQMYAHSREWAGLWTASDGSSTAINERPPVAAIYLGPSIASLNSASGANIPGISAPVTLQSARVYFMDSTWKNLPGVNFSDPYTVPASLTTILDATQATTQASNFSNYVGWNSNFQDNLLSYNDGQDKSLLRNASKSLRETKSYAGSMQSFLWNDAIVPTLGWRFDEVKSRSVSALSVNSNRASLNLNETGAASTQPYALPDWSTTLNANQGRAIFKDHSTAGGVVVHVNKILGDKDPLPINVSLSYNKSNNFQVTDARRDFYGNLLPNPQGATKDYGVLLSTKDGKYSFRMVKYDSLVTGGSAPIDLSGIAGTITQGLKFRNVFLYRMSLYDWPSREQSDLSNGKRYWWHPSYVANGRPVANITGGAIPAGAVLETQAQADARRDASISAWNAIQNTLAAKGFFTAWNYTPTTASALTTRAIYEQTLGPNTEQTTETQPRTVPVQNNASLIPVLSSLASYAFKAPAGLTVTSDTQSKGYEFELTANPLSNLRLSFNASQTKAIRTNLGGQYLDDLVAYMDTQMAGFAGDMRQFNGDYSAGNEVRQNWANWRGQYTLLKLQQGAAAAEIRKWRYNVVANYGFNNGILKGAGVGASYRWQDKVVIGYPVIGSGNAATFDLSNPYYGPAEDAMDVWASYERKITEKIKWKIQINVRNLLKNESLIPISIEPDGKTWASARISPVQEWFMTNTFSF